MSAYVVLHVDAYSDVPGMGNPAGVLRDGDSLSADRMQDIARAVGFNETVFICRSDKADYRLRYFTPGHETPLCGHATVAAIYTLCGDCPEDRELTIETGAGLLPVYYDANSGTVRMRQAEPEFVPFSGDPEALLAALGTRAACLAPGLPIVYGNTGSWTLLVPLREEAVLSGLTPENALFPSLLREKPRSSIHPFVVTDGGDCDFLARHFSSPYSGTREDPVTGTASGVMGAYALRHLFPEREQAVFRIRQGKSVGRDGLVVVEADRAGRIFVSGKAALVGEMKVEI